MKMPKTITKTALSLYLASQLLTAGCISHSYSSTKHSISDIQPVRVEFVEKRQTKTLSLDELMQANKDASKTFQYTDRLGNIKKKIKSDLEYKPTTDIRRLVYDIDHSRLDNKLLLSQEIKDFGYYRFDRVKHKAYNQNKAGTVLLWIGGIIGISYLVSEADSADNYSQGESFAITAGLLSLVSIGALQNLFKESHNTYYNKSYYQPYYDKLETIEENLPRPK